MPGFFHWKQTPPMRLRRLPLEGAHLAARQSRFRGCPRTDFAVLVLVSRVAESAPASWSADMKFEHRHAAHCESGVISNMLRHHGVPMTESLAFGLASALTFAYFPFIK